MLLCISHHVICWAAPMLIPAELPWRSTAAVKFRSKVKYNRVTAQPLPCAFFGVKQQCLCIDLLLFISTCGFESMVNFGKKGEVLDYSRTNVLCSNRCLYKQVIPLMLACTLPFVSSKDMMEKVLLEEGQ